MASEGTDVLMQLNFDSGPLPAECQTEVDTDMDDYVSDYYNGTFFEVKSFSFGMNIDDQDPKKDNVNPGASGQHAQTIAALGSSMTRATPAQLQMLQQLQQKESKFGRWKAATPEMLRTMKCYPVRMDDVTIKRYYDKASPVLFKQCCNSGSFASASIVKRKDVGGNLLRGYLRMDFQDVLITHLDWSNGEVMEEEFKFKFRKVVIKYRATSFKKGTTEAVLQEQPHVGWDYDTELRNRNAPMPT